MENVQAVDIQLSEAVVQVRDPARHHSYEAYPPTLPAR